MTPPDPIRLLICAATIQQAEHLWRTRFNSDERITLVSFDDTSRAIEMIRRLNRPIIFLGSYRYTLGYDLDNALTAASATVVEL